MKPNLPVLLLSVGLGLGAWKGLNALFGPDPRTRSHDARETSGDRPVRVSDQEWKARLDPEQYDVMRGCGTEPPFSGRYNAFFGRGTYLCAGCGAPLFRSDAKYDARSGWPSFTAPYDGRALEYRDDFSFMMRRTEVRCAVCGAHLGHVFPDGPAPTGDHYCINSVALRFLPAGDELPAAGAPAPKASPAGRAAAAPRERATFAAGCFWGVEHKLRAHPGVLDTQVGYTGGTAPKPTYAEVCSDATGHAEAVDVVFDPARVSFEDLVRFFFALHDPTQVDRQGPDVGSQYRSAIFYRDDAQRRTAERVRAELDASGRFSAPIATRILPATEFYRAEERHQRYYDKNDKK